MLPNAPQAELESQVKSCGFRVGYGPRALAFREAFPKLAWLGTLHPTSGLNNHIDSNGTTAVRHTAPDFADTIIQEHLGGAVVSQYGRPQDSGTIRNRSCRLLSVLQSPENLGIRRIRRDNSFSWNESLPPRSS